MANEEKHGVDSDSSPVGNGRETSLPLPEEGLNPEARFRQLASRWKEDTQFLSSVTEMSMHPAYQQIIGMGREALPWLLDELRHQPDHWFWALWAITGVDPVPAADRGNVDKMSAAWLEWGRTHGL